MTDTQAWVPCWRCGKPAAPQGEHHEPFRSQGGTEEDRTPLCRGCHRDRHAGRFTIQTDEQMAICLDPDGHVLSIRPLVPAETVRNLGDESDLDFLRLRKSLELLSDDGLCYFWSQCNRRAGQSFIAQGIVAEIFFDRCGRGDAWYEHAARILECAPATVYRRYNAWQYLKTRPDPLTEVESVGWELSAALGYAAVSGADAGKLAEEIVPLVESGEVSRTEAARRVRQATTKTAAPEACRHQWVCSLCGETK